ncbi:MAG: four helix bundle protein [Bacteroidales bacterium]|jgi:four helix bundle protein|nr:four helix bundle protein [Bacteroidales bacterium]MDD4215307.1 four helix bundle protein [Bacteroidales bacterium]
MENERPTFFFRFEDLRIYNKAIEYVLWMYSNTELFPDAGKHGLAGKMILSAQAIAINIAEGSGRNKTQFIYYLKMAKSSIRECIVLTTIAQKLNFLDKIAADESRNTLIEMTKMVGALIASLQRSEKPGEKTDEEDDIQPPFDKS